MRPAAATHVRPTRHHRLGDSLISPSGTGPGTAHGPSNAAYARALDYLYARTTGGFKFGLERTRELLNALGDPQHAFPALHIAGTNGKGSSVATAEAVLRAKGMRVGRYTSPHLVDFRERIVVGGQCIPADTVIDFVEHWTPVVERLGATFFEATTALAFLHFALARVDVAIVETGLGGRLDSTNVIDPVAAGVTTIDYDHTEYLGDTLELIAAEKAGIFKRHRPAVIGESDRALAAVLAHHASEAEARPIWLVADECRVSDVAVGPEGTTFTLTTRDARQSMRTPLVGRHQAENAAFAFTLLSAAGAPYAATLDETAKALALVEVPGRFQRVGRYIFDVAHNEEGARVLAQTLVAVRPAPPVTALFSVLADKDWREMMRHLQPCVDRFVLSTAPSAPSNRQWDIEAAHRHAASIGAAAEVVRDFHDALARATSFDGTMLVTGSFHTVGDAMARLQLSPLCG